MDTSEFKKRFLPHYSRIYRIAFAITGNSQDAEDITQNLFTKLFTSRNKLDNIQNPEAYLVKLVKNLSIDLTRTKHYQQRKQNLAISTPTILNITSPQYPSEHQEQLEKIKSIITHLPPNQQQALRLHAIEGLEYREIQEIMGISSANLRTLISRARKFITAQLKSDE